MRRHVSRWLRTARRHASGIVLLATLLLVGLLHAAGEVNVQLLGFAQGESLDVTSTELGRVASVDVALGEQVRAGQVVATLDTAEIDAKIDVAKAERAEIVAAVEAGRARLSTKVGDTLAELERDMADASAQLLRAQSLSTAVDGQRERLKKLVDSKQATLDALTKLDLQAAELTPLARSKRATMGLLQQQIADLRKRLADPTLETVDLSARIESVDARIRLLELRRADHVLRAGMAGKVSEVVRPRGDVVRPGEAVVRLVTSPGRVVACVPETAMLDTREGTRARMLAREVNAPVLTGRVIARSPVVRELPTRCRANLRVPSWGREIVIELPSGTETLVGQSYDVELGGTWALPDAIASAMASPIPGTTATAIEENASDLSREPQPLRVPAALRRVSRFEPSGIAPEPNGRGYLIVSDDTGLDSERLPLLFRMDRDGRLAEDPVPIEGIDEVTDLESLAVGSDGTVYALSSQSYSAHGKRPAARTVFMALVSDGDGYRVRAAVHLAELLDRAGAPALQKLGIGKSTKELDIEGLALRDGALYLGLKSPLDETGHALVWRLGHPGVLFDSSSLEAAGLELFGRVKLEAGSAPTAPAGGISELLWLPDGGLLIASTPSSQDAEQGAIYLVPSATSEGPWKAKQLGGFEHHKPEGLALSLRSSDQVVVVFDAGAREPYLLEMPWR